MKKDSAYKIVIGILLAIIILQWVFFVISQPKHIPPRAAIKPRPKIAIVLDDWGYNLNTLHILEQIKYPLTCAVLPDLNYSQQICEELHARGFQIILHLPMEPHEKYRLERNTIMTTMDEPAIRNIVKQNIDNVIYAKGVSNHMGSLATEDPRTMKIIFKELKQRNLFFLDSFVTSNSVGFELAHKMGLHFAKRDVFLDNQLDLEYIKRQIYKLKTKAKIYGYAIGIGHDQKVTLEALKDIMPELEKEGYRFVLVSELAK